jgi:hypothetical protein
MKTYSKGGGFNHKVALPLKGLNATLQFGEVGHCSTAQQCNAAHTIHNNHTERLINCIGALNRKTAVFLYCSAALRPTGLLFNELSI